MDKEDTKASEEESSLFEYVPDPLYEGEPYQSQPCENRRGVSYTPPGWKRKYTNHPQSKKRKALKFD